MTFMNNLDTTLNKANNISYTENGAVGFKTTGKALVDLNFSIPKLRGMNDEDIVTKCSDALINTPINLFLKWIFYVRDIKGGLGERNIFRALMAHIAQNSPELIRDLVKYIPVFGRWDDILVLLDTPLRSEATKVIKDQLLADLTSMRMGKPVSLLAKWLPSVNASSIVTRKYALKIIDSLDVNAEMYRKTLAELRAYIDVIEAKMSRSDWESINYEHVPSRANLLYKEAFMRHDSERREAYLESLNSGDAKINASVVFPHEIVHSLNCNWNGDNTVEEQMWKALPNLVAGDKSVIVVRDGSGSMEQRMPKSNAEVLDVATGLALYFAERLKGEFKNKFITFSANPYMVDISGCKTLKEKLALCNRFTEAQNTNIEKVFMLILKTAIDNEMEQEDLPDTILLISDMEFDRSVFSDVCTDPWEAFIEPKLFDTISEKYAEYGYKIPKVVFWNVANRSGSIPMVENELGVVLVSGYSINNVNMVMSGKTDPYAALLEQLMSERYVNIVGNTDAKPKNIRWSDEMLNRLTS